MAKTQPKHKHKKNPGSICIIAGRWRGRRLIVGNSEGLRPSPARLRETLFNWLAPHIAHSQVWDLFAGSGALGIEARSRGATRVQLIEKNPATCSQLQKQLQILNDPALTLQQSDALHWLTQQNQAADILFLDPPFAENLLPAIIEQINRHQLINPNGWIYIESAQTETDPQTYSPAHWHLHRQQQSKQVRSQLYQVQTEQSG